MRWDPGWWIDVRAWCFRHRDDVVLPLTAAGMLSSVGYWCMSCLTIRF